MNTKQYDLAFEKLVELEEAGDDLDQVLPRLLLCAGQIENWPTVIRVGEILAESEPGDPGFQLALVSGYMSQGFATHAIKSSKVILEQWPGMPGCAELKGLHADLTTELDELAKLAGLSREDFFAARYENETIQQLMMLAKIDEALRRSVDLMKAYPTFLPVINNLADIYLAKGNFDEARRVGQSALEIEPENEYALTFAIRLARLSFADAAVIAEFAERLFATITPDHPPTALLIEGLTFAGANEKVIEAVSRINLGEEDPEDRAAILHYAGVAHYNLGDLNRAERAWKDVLKIDRDHYLASMNLVDLKSDVALRHGPVVFEIPFILPVVVLEEIVSLGLGDGSEDPSAFTDYLRNLLAAQPIVATLLPAIFEFSADQSARPFAELLKIIDDPRIRDYAAKFALGQRGSDELRFSVARNLVQTGYAFDPVVKIWLEGEQRETILMGCQIVYDADDSLPPAVDAALRKAFGLTVSGKYAQAEKEFEKAIKTYPGYPTLVFNYAVAIQSQGRIDEAVKIVEALVCNHPTYIFGRAALATHYASEGDIVKAREWIAPLKLQGKLHVGELRAIAGAHIDIVTNDPLAKAADMAVWLNMLEDADPENPRLDNFWDNYEYLKEQESAAKRIKSPAKSKKNNSKLFGR